MAQTLQKMIFNDHNNFTHVLVAHYCKLKYSNNFSGVSTILKKLKVKSGKLKVAILTTDNLELTTQELKATMAVGTTSSHSEQSS